MIAIIAAIHGNLEALQAVLEDIAKRNINTIYCLGDVIGYGPNPRECIEIVRDRCEFSLMGDFDESILFCTHFYQRGTVEETTIDWIRNQLNSKQYEEEQNYRLWDFIGNLQQKVCRDNCLYVHSFPRSNRRSFPVNFEQLKFAFSHLGNYNVCFSGASHIPSVFTEEYQYHYAANINNFFHLSSTNKQIIDVGSVGKPRDGDTRACYVICDKKTVQWIRVIYNIEETIEQIYNCSLPDIIADNLRTGS